MQVVLRSLCTRSTPGRAWCFDLRQVNEKERRERGFQEETYRPK